VKEKESRVWKKLVFLNAIANHGISFKYLTEVKNYSFNEIAVGFADETVPQLTGNTVIVWSFGKPEVKKNPKKEKLTRWDSTL